MVKAIFVHTARAAAAVIFLCILLMGGRALADEAYIIAASDDNQTQTQNDVQIAQLQERLRSLGYYEKDITMIYDGPTRYAVYRFCETNGAAYSDEGVSLSLWDSIMSDDAIPAPESDALQYEDIPFGAVGNDVLLLQTKLKELGYYYDDSVVLVPSVLDEGTQKALEAFCEINHIDFPVGTATAELQYLLFSGSAAAYVSTETKPTLPARLGAYMTRQAPLLGSSAPVWLFWVCGLIAAAAVGVLLVYRFRGFKKEKPSEADAARSYWRRRAEELNSGVITHEQLGSTGWTLDIEFRYRGSVQNITRVCATSLTIGRNPGCDIPTNPEDRYVSGFHCELFCRGSMLMLRDQSGNGTTLNGQLLRKTEECRLNSGDVICVGDHRIAIQVKREERAAL